MDTQRIQRAGQLGMRIAIKEGDETVEEITRKTLSKAGPAIADELIRTIKAEFGGPRVEWTDVAAHIRSELGEL